MGLSSGGVSKRNHGNRTLPGILPHTPPRHKGTGRATAGWGASYASVPPLGGPPLSIDALRVCWVWMLGRPLAHWPRRSRRAWDEVGPREVPAGRPGESDNASVPKPMQRVLFEYYVDPTTWVYLSSLMTIGIYFKFRRFWSVRNVDLIGLIAFAPGLLLVAHDQPRPGLPLAVRRRRGLPVAAVDRPDDGPPAAAGAEPVGRRADVHGRGAVGLSGGQRGHRQADRKRPRRRRTDGHDRRPADHAGRAAASSRSTGRAIRCSTSSRPTRTTPSCRTTRPRRFRCRAGRWFARWRRGVA